jgi:hypothetical protein
MDTKDHILADRVALAGMILCFVVLAVVVQLLAH